LTACDDEEKGILLRKGRMKMVDVDDDNNDMTMMMI